MYRRRGSAPFKFEKAYEMRHNPTPAEARMWEIIKGQMIPNFPNHIFYRQSVQFGYILDFYCPTLRLGIEVDGAIHNERKWYDWQKDTNLARRQIQMYRFSNVDVFNNPQGVATRLFQIIQDKTMPWYATSHASALPNQKDCKMIQEKSTPWYKKIFRFLR